jgi:hypothetical protein
VSARKVDVHGILERAGANPDAPEGSHAWALAQVGAAVAELIEAASELAEHYHRNVVFDRLRAALARIGSAS